MSKQEQDELPPSYNEATLPSYPQSSATTISSTLSSLTSLLRTTQAQQSALDTITTTNLLPLLTPHLTSLLTGLCTTPNPPSLAELVFVPAAAVGPEWSITSDADRKAGELVQVIRVSHETDEKGGDEKKTSSRPSAPSSSSSLREFDDWGRWGDDDDDDAAAAGGRGSSSKEEQWWWDDENMARRLAKQLQPEPKVDRTTVRTVVEQAKEKKKASRWGLFKTPSEASSSTSTTPSQQKQYSRSSSSSSKSGTPAKQDEDVTMTVRAEEVTFRRENKMGIWEGTHGWGIVARVRIRR